MKQITVLQEERAKLRKILFVCGVISGNCLLKARKHTSSGLHAPH